MSITEYPLQPMTATTCTPTVDGVAFISWIHTLFGECVYGWQECASLLLGYLSILCWLNAQMPQVIKNYRLQSADSLSFSFLTVWLIGDVANFIGCQLTGQLVFQMYLSVYFITIDTILCMQWLYYVRFPDNMLRRWLNPRWVAQERVALLSDSTPTATASPQRYQALLAVGWMMTMGLAPSALTTSTPVTATAWDRATRDLWTGRFFAWLCTCLYLSSRIPQIRRNIKRQSVEGLAMSLFFFAASGNLTYTLSIFTNPHQTRQTLLEAVPYILGSAGTLLFDATIFAQYLIYNRRTQEKASASSV